MGRQSGWGNSEWDSGLMGGVVVPDIQLGELWMESEPGECWERVGGEVILRLGSIGEVY